MARPLRTEFRGAVYHIYNQGDNKEDIFLSDTDRQSFLRQLTEVVQKYKWLVHSYCLMPNHYHLLVETPLPNLSAGMHLLVGSYTQIFNHRHGRVGHVFKGRFSDKLIQDAPYLLQVSRYSVLNPVYDDFVQSPAKWRWSNYRAYMGMAEIPRFLTTDWILGAFSSDRRRARALYREFVMFGIKHRDITEYINHQRMMGRHEFIESLFHALQVRPVPADLENKKERVPRPALDQIFWEVDMRDFRARDAAICSAHLNFGHSQRKIAKFLGIAQSRVSQIVRTSQKKH